MSEAATGEPIKLARELYRALAEGDRKTLTALLHPGFEGYGADGMPLELGKRYEGPEAMRREFWGCIAEHFQARAEPEEFHPLGDGRLLVTGRYRGHGRASGRGLDAAFAHVLSIAEHRIRRLVQLTDTQRWHDALGAEHTLTTVDYTVTGGIAVVRLNRPEQGNAINLAMTRELAEIAARLAEDDTVRVVLLLGSGPRLTTGGDIDLFSTTPREKLPSLLRRMVDDYHRAFQRLLELDAPLVVGVRGAAAGGGLGLVCAADYAIAGEDAVFALGYARLGLSADGGTTWFLPRLVGLRRAQEMFLLNRRLDAAEATEAGLINRVVPDGDVEAEARTVATRLAAGPTRAYGGMCRLLRASYDSDLGTQLDAEQHTLVEIATGEDAAEGIAAFAAGRRPGFSGR
jgi:2-(1,2-epoxy-1,2-dihydrophenyl)acetyl-CoA isomerase